MASIKVRNKDGTITDLLRGEPGEVTHEYMNNNFSPALKATATGNPVLVPDAFNEVSVNVDVGGATVKKYGKNLMDLTKISSKGQCTYDATTGKLTSNQVNQYYCSLNNITYLNDLFIASKGKHFTFTTGRNEQITGIYSMALVYGRTEVGGAEIYKAYTGKTSVLTFPIIEDFVEITKLVIRFNYSDKPKTDTTTVYDKLQLELGGTDTEYEPYAEPVSYTADENGIVSGITASGEDMTLFADNGTPITVEYNRDISKVIDKLYAALT